MSEKLSALDKVNVHIAAWTRGKHPSEDAVRRTGESGGMSASYAKAMVRWFASGSTIALMAPGIAQAQTTPPPVDQTQQTEEKRPSTANASSAEAPQNTPGNAIVITGIRAS